MKKEKQYIKDLLKETGITLNGPKSYDPQIHDDRFYGRIIKQSSLGLGEAYMDGWWDCEQLDEFFTRLMSAEVSRKIKIPLSTATGVILKALFSAGTKSKAFEIGEAHYDAGNDLYALMLDSRLTYTCGYWKDVENLEQAQEAKLDLICRKIGLTEGKRVLDIGSGWGSFMGYAAEKYGVQTVGLTVSKEQKAYTDERYKHYSVETKLMDYRDETGKYDAVVSLGMFEHVGFKHYITYMQCVHNMLEDDGLFLLHTIGGDITTKGTDKWVDKYIFPNGILPSVQQIGAAIEGLFIVEDWHNFGADYDATLMAWHKNFEDSWDSIKSEYDERFYRMWRYYLLMFAGTFRARKNQLWQVVLSKKGVRGGYKSIR